MTSTVDQWYLSGPLGLGTTAPGAQLSISSVEPHVRLDSTGDRAVVQLGKAGSLQWDFGVGTGAGNNDFWFGDYSGYRLVLQKGTGNVGIGVPAPVSKLQVGGDIALHSTPGGAKRPLPAGATMMWSDSTWLRLNQNLDYSKPIFGVHTPGVLAPVSLNVGGAGAWGDPGAGNAWIAGSLGIGTATPQAKLHVAGGLWNPTDTEGDLKVGDAAHRLKIGVATAGGGAGDVRLRAHGGTNRLMLGSGTVDTLFVVGDRIGIGTIAPAVRLDVAGDIRLGASNTLSAPGRLHIAGDEILYLLNRGGVIIGQEWGGTGSLTVQGRVQLAANNAQVIIGGNQTGLFMQLHDDLWFSDPQNGSIQTRNSNNSNWGTMVGWFNWPSSMKFKKDVKRLKDTDLDTFLDDVLKTDVAQFRYTGDPETSGLRVGVIAEECPPYLGGVDGESLSLGEYVGMLHAAIKALANRVKKLEQRVGR